MANALNSLAVYFFGSKMHYVKRDFDKQKRPLQAAIIAFHHFYRRNAEWPSSMSTRIN